uniref:IRG-type G domain-containing protein n=1 Tax=Lotharella globosa TaxID=91324 RepID=A0A7S3YLQ8_9EUKA|mmetsp:Transcript_6177/g.12262  ORF Transcript_6177/g.12262 Transcript_6177/m.12262 type:complete len:582 (+) Transcript_6177:13-1758(+)
MKAALFLAAAFAAAVLLTANVHTNILSSAVRRPAYTPTQFRAAAPRCARMQNLRAFSAEGKSEAYLEWERSVDWDSLPYNAKEVGLNTAVEMAARRRDTAAARVLEKVRRAQHEAEMAGRDVPWYRGGSKDRERYDGVMVMSPLEEQRMQIERTKREQDQAAAEEVWKKEDELVQYVRSQGLRIDDRDQFGLPMDVAKILEDAAAALHKALSEPTQGPKLISLKTAIDPMPWWEFDPNTIPVGIARVLKSGAGYGKVAVVPPGGVSIPDELLRYVDVNDVDGADVVYVMNPDLSNPNIIHELHSFAQRSRTGDVIVLNGYFGEPSDRDGKAVRQTCKELFTGGVQAIQFIMEPVRLTRNVGGDPYPLPEWLKATGYKATGNLAITGNSGTGKSSLNNAMRGLKPRDDGAAAVGVKETTLEPTPYDITVDGHEMKMYDLPGAGTPKFPLDTYVRNMGIKYFDLVIVASAGRFTENDLELMDELRRNGVPFFALRTKIDLELRNAESDGTSADETIQKIRTDLEHYTMLPSDKIYMVSSRRPEEFDFQRLKQDTNSALTRALDVKLAKALTRKLEIKGVWNAV